MTHDIGVVADTATEVACLNKHLHFHGTTEDFKSLDEVEISKSMVIQFNSLIINITERVAITMRKKLMKLNIKECNL